MDEIFKCPFCGDAECGIYTVERIVRCELFDFAGYPLNQIEDEVTKRKTDGGLTPAFCRNCHKMLGYVDPEDCQSSYTPTRRVRDMIRKEMKIHK